MVETDRLDGNDARRVRVDRSPFLLAGAGALWFAVTLWSVHRLITTAATVRLGVTIAAFTLSDLLAGALLAGTAVGLAAASVGAKAGPRWRVLAGVMAGVVVAAAASGLLLINYSRAGTLVALATAIATAALLGGAVAGAATPAAVGAAVASTLGWYGVRLVEGLFRRTLRDLFTGGASPAAQLAGAGRLSYALAVAGGAIAGLVSYSYLRRRDRLRWPTYLAAGAAPGTLLVLAEIMARIGGGPLLRIAGADAADRLALAYVASVRLNTALVVLFAGAITTMACLGRALPPDHGKATGQSTS